MSKGKRNALGKGLSALLMEAPVLTKEEIKESNESIEIKPNGIYHVKLDEIILNPFQPRTDFDQDALLELSQSIKNQGIIQPITVRILDSGDLQLISGERRVQASKLAKLETIPAYVRNVDDKDMLELALIENIQREDLNAIEIALTYQRLIYECQLKQEQLGDRVGKKRSTVNNYLRLLKLPPEIQIALRNKQLTMGHARALINVDNIDIQLTLYKKIIQEDLSVRKVEQLVREIVSGVQKKKVDSKDNSERAYFVEQMQTKLGSHFGTKVTIRASDKNKGEIKIPFLSGDDFNRIMEIFNFND